MPGIPAGGDGVTATLSDLHESYMLAREAQDVRAEAYSQGHCEELDRFYGRGEHREDPIEQPVTWKTWIKSAAGERAAWEESCEQLLREVGPEPAERIGELDIDPIAPADRSEWARITVREVARPETMAEDAFRMSGAELAILVQRGDRVAAAEVDRRLARRAVKAGRVRKAGWAK